MNSSACNQSAGELYMHRSEAIRFIILRSVGNFLLLFSLYGVVATFGPSLIVEAQFRIAQVRGMSSPM